MTSHCGVDEGESQNGTERDGFKDSDIGVAREGGGLGLCPEPRWSSTPSAPGIPPHTLLGLHTKRRWDSAPDPVGTPHQTQLGAPAPDLLLYVTQPGLGQSPNSLRIIYDSGKPAGFVRRELPNLSEARLAGGL